MIIRLDNLSKTQEFAKHLARCTKNLNQGVVIYLNGDLGAGKTTLARSFIQTFGFDRVKSPTYALVESYVNQEISIHHFDCYRLSDPEELEYIGIREYSGSGHIQLIEWAELGQGIIASADMSIDITGEGSSRKLSIQMHSTIGEQLLTCLST
ncbi:tRNA (adenosine(37)-N6)-threonylcarbamoyltransferase complex ATPase subunit type 1 TsaE [Bathymodiolus heckerae thiotrophic gill symbiont]|uniref:tRNA (adenosine(37)-N6)-threonylcarbamoyltransferase complex ATPase subunit type 1 TsaE n=1 Tax=Bathymodiolus heckerae thiotrophic gill symbiont TaxID=1052212 RepID=UPI001A252258|nr:tRNA (adenosine(37)-N6)-threonylcarbamoyltransferase complex ATPase subunit type 1 TsaE [Bathymodiolus heckerae thiotrophic gill symbiont]CAC9529159.1 tRNA threonylcarbamoyladenosine biosynthesis protein TsaE [uncultured Gammaproteobacteria bacterium]CAC9961808.1 tRNA threonylcarbamoyladenosine biosynthesis protein TsaE [uncultured Gammaproteobacteria bacterium]